MKGFAKIALSIALIAVIVLSIVVASVAWFTSSPQVGANDVTMTSARTLTVTFDSNEEGSDFRYHGQIGNTGRGTLDAPYVYEAGGFNVHVDTLSSDDRYASIKVEFGTVDVVTQSVGTISGVLPDDLFHVEVYCYTRRNNGRYVEIDYREGDPEKTINRNVFVDYDALERYADSALTEPDYENGAYVEYNGRAYSYATLAAKDKYDRTTYYLDDDGTLTDGSTAVLFTEGDYRLSFSFTFLPEDAYQTWLLGRNYYSSIVGYERAVGGDYIGIVTYSPYVARQHFGLQRYARSGTEGNYTYTPDPNGTYVRVETDRMRDHEGMQRYARSGTGGDYTYTEDPSGDYVLVGGEYEEYSPIAKYGVQSYSENQNGLYKKTGDVFVPAAANETVTRYDVTFAPAQNGAYIETEGVYLLYNRYNQINGFPYSNDRYRGAKYQFKVNCSVEEVDE